VRPGRLRRGSKGLALRSQKSKDQDAARDACRQEVLLRDGGCVFHRMERAQGLFDQCGGPLSGPDYEVHEIITRRRGGSKTDPTNCVALCSHAHRWVTAHPCGAEAIGLMLPSWATTEIVVDASRRRLTYRTGPWSYSTPWWREGDIDFIAAAQRDLRERGWSKS